MQKKLVLAIVPLLMLGLQASAQTYNATPATYAARQALLKKPKPIRTELSVGYRLNTDGWSIYADKGYVKSDEPRLSDQFYNLRIFELEFGEHKDRTQHKQKPDDGSGSDPAKPYVFGKVNNFYAFKLGYGFRKLIAGKPEPGTVSIHWIGTGGISIGLIKPYYIEAYAPQDNFGSTLVRQSLKYSDEKRDYFLNPYYIVGGSGFAKGLGEIQVAPGLHAKTGLHFDFAGSKKTVLAVETGVSAELYFQKIQIMARDDGQPYFVNAFVALQFGKRK